MTNPATDLNDLRDTLSAAVSLGLPVPAIAGTTAVEVTIYGLDYDDPNTSLGLYQSKEAAIIALRNFVIERYDDDIDSAPWFPVGNPTDAEIAEERTAFLAARTDEEIIASMFGDSEYYFTDHKIEPNPTRTI
jgi:hypothetical protein